MFSALEDAFPHMRWDLMTALESRSQGPSKIDYQRLKFLFICGELKRRRDSALLPSQTLSTKWRISRIYPEVMTLKLRGKLQPFSYVKLEQPHTITTIHKKRGPRPFIACSRK